MFMLMCNSLLLLFMVNDKLSIEESVICILIVGIGNIVVQSHRRTVQIICAGCNYIIMFNSYCPVCSSDLESDDFFQHCIWLWNLPMILKEFPPLRILSLINLNKHDLARFLLIVKRLNLTQLGIGNFLVFLQELLLSTDDSYSREVKVFSSFCFGRRNPQNNLSLKLYTSVPRFMRAYFSMEGMWALCGRSSQLKWHMAWLVLKNGQQKDMCYGEIGLCAQKYRHHSRFSSEHNWEGLYAHLKRVR